VAREYGGILYHCCMGYDRHFESLAKTDYFWGFDPDPAYNDFDKIEATLAQAHGIWWRVCGRRIWSIFADYTARWACFSM